jgi:hypothetical protein
MALVVVAEAEFSFIVEADAPDVLVQAAPVLAHVQVAAELVVLKRIFILEHSLAWSNLKKLLNLRKKLNKKGGWYLYHPPFSY